MFLVSCRHMLDIAPAVLEAGSAAWWIDKGAGAIGLQGAPYALLQAAKAYSQGYERGAYDKLEEKRKEH